MDYCIGIIDEDSAEVGNIQRTIIENKPHDVLEDEIYFCIYPLSENAGQLTEAVVATAINDIIDKSIQALIIDYQILVDSELVKGTDIFQQITEVARKFPTVILTNRPEDCYAIASVDADKVYNKRYYFKLEDDYAAEKTANIFRNIRHYNEQRASLAAKHNEHLENLRRDGCDAEILQSIIMIEKQLNDYSPQEQNILDHQLDLSELREAVQLLQNADSLLEEQP